MKKLAFLLAAFLSVFAMACGGSSDSDDSETLSQADAVAKGDEACLTASEDLDKVTQEYSEALKDFDLQTAGDQLDEMIAVSKSRNEALAAIQVDGDTQESLDEYVEINDESIDRMEDMASALADKDIEGVTNATKEIATLNVEGQAAASDFGFESCGTGVAAAG